MKTRPFCLTLLILFSALPAVGQSFISGRVTGPSGSAHPGAIVAAYNTAGELIQTQVTSFDGSYTLSLPAATYRVLAYDPSGNLATSYYRDASSFETSALLTVAPGASLSGVDMRLLPGFRVTGTVSAPAGPDLSQVIVAAYNLDGTRRAFEKTDSMGTFGIVLPAGAYKFVAYDDRGALAPVFYANQRSFESAVTVLVNGPVAGIFFSLETGARVTGRVVSAENGQPLSGIEVASHQLDGTRLLHTLTDAQGNFTLILPPATYKFSAVDQDGEFSPVFYPSSSSAAAAPTFSLTAGQVLQSIDFALSRVTDPAGLTHLYVPGVANTPGANNTYFQTDVWIYNPNAKPVEIRIDLIGSPASPRSATRLVAARAQIQITNVLHDLFGVGGAGALELSSDLPFIATTRTYNNPPNATEVGTYGLSIPAQRISQSLSRAVLPGLSHDSRRSNVGILNPHDHAILVRYELLTPGGALLGSTERTLAPKQWVQDNIFLLLGVAPPIDHAYARLISTGGSFFSYAAVVDGKSGDSTLILPEADPPDEK
ncbi:MAG TPA: carboxypeptidase regulatory-like domain-containing protein [Thermoanaerobaculia bacterium]|nr:carboxypeptidase regulatory-like domain-containing protein [Thermoanaerobaculia bacterium]